MTLTVPGSRRPRRRSASVAMFDAARAKVPVPVDAQTDVRIKGLLDADGIFAERGFRGDVCGARRGGEDFAAHRSGAPTADSDEIGRPRSSTDVRR
ncbi:MAG: hypothetical protein M5R36_16205 [Deltaproteobacteria bacterium]|nr:hypothetical protein [Deltaproteobacteria bacterium]